jgi:uncharacterized protein YjbI with pentapeptide repeats
MTGANLAGALCGGASFVDAVLTSVTFGKAKLKRARFGGYDISTTLSGVDFSDDSEPIVIQNHGTDLRGADLREIDLSGITGLDDIDLTRAVRWEDDAEVEGWEGVRENAPRRIMIDGMAKVKWAVRLSGSYAHTRKFWWNRPTFRVYAPA